MINYLLPRNFFRKQSNAKISICFIIILGIVFRCLGLSSLPPYVDETGNILSALSDEYAAVVDPNGGGRILLRYLFEPVQWFGWNSAEQAVWVGRGLILVLSVFTGLTLSSILWIVSGSKAAHIGALLWAINPYLVVHDRLAIQDPVTGFFALFALFLCLKIQPEQANTQSILFAILAGCCWSVCVLNKVIGISASFWSLALWIVLKPQTPKKFFVISFVAGISLFLLVCPKLADFGYLLPFQSRSIFDFASRGEFALHFSNSLGAFFNAMRIYNGPWFIGLMLLVWLLTINHLPQFAAFKLVMIATLFGEALMYMSSAFDRYFYPTVLLWTLFLSLVLAASTPQQPATSVGLSRFLRVLCLLLLPTVCASGVFRVLQFSENHPFHPPEACEQGILLDYCQYFDAAPSGGGLAELQLQILKEIESTGPQNIYVGNFWLGASNYLLLSALRNPKLHVIPTPLSGRDTPIYLAGWQMRNESNAGLIVLDDNAERFYFAETQERSLQGVDLQLIARVARNKSPTLTYSIFRIEKIRKELILPLMSPKPMSPDGALAPLSKLEANEINRFRKICNPQSIFNISIKNNGQLIGLLEPQTCKALAAFPQLLLVEPKTLQFDTWISEHDPYELNWVYRNKVRAVSAILR